MLVFLTIKFLNVLLLLEIRLIFYKISLKETPSNGCFLSNIASAKNQTLELCFFFLGALILKLTYIKQ